MQITDVRQHHLSHDVGGTFRPTWIPGYPQGTHEVELFEVETDAGITGLAASPSFAGGVDYEDALSFFLLGEDPHDVGAIRRKLDSVNLVGPRPWHLEMALWDVIGKDAGKPVYELLGGTGDPIRAYASTGEVQPAEERVAYVRERVAEGFEAVKLRVETPDDLDVVREVREAFPDLTLMVDANKGWSVRVMAEEERWSYKEALAVARELEDVGGVAWLEEPLPRHDYDGYARLRAATDVPIAGGEFNDGRHHFREFLDRDALDVVQPDVALATGIRGGVEVAGRAREAGVQFVPHTWTNGLGFAANLHVMAAVDAPWCEYPDEPPWTPEARDFLLAEPEPVQYLRRLEATGPDFNGFNLIFGRIGELYSFNNREGSGRLLEPGVHGLSNDRLNSSWPKVVRSRQRLQSIVDRGGQIAFKELFDLLSDRTRPEDSLLPDTGVGLETERLLSPVFIESPGYGTRTSTVMLIDTQGRVDFMEQTHPPPTEKQGASLENAPCVHFRLTLQPN